MRVFMVYVPQVWAGADRFQLRFVLDDLERRALRNFRGLTIHPPARGMWVDDQETLHVDQVAPWEIATDDEAAVMAFAEIVRERTNQIAVYVREAGTATIITKGS